MGCIVDKNVAPSNASNESTANHGQRQEVNNLFRSPSVRIPDAQQDTTQTDQQNDARTIDNRQGETRGTVEVGRNDSGYNEGRGNGRCNDEGKNDSGYGRSNGDGELCMHENMTRHRTDHVDGSPGGQGRSVEETPIEELGNHVGTANLNRTNSTNLPSDVHDDTIPSLELPIAESTPRIVGNNVRRHRSRQSPRRKAKLLGCMPLCSSVVRPNKRCKITGCTYLPNGFLVIVDNRNRQAKLYDTNLKCCSFIAFNERPFDICELDGRIYVTFPQPKLVQKLSITFPMLFMTRKLIKRSSFPTEGECSAIVGYKKDLIVSLWFRTHVNTSVADTAWQIQIIAKAGQVKRRISHDSDGTALFFDARYLALTPNKKEIVISEGEDNRIKCLNIETAELTFNHHMEDPKGLVCDKSGNIYVLGKHGTIRWILADREYVKVLLKGTRSINYSECITYLKERNTLAVPRNENKIELYKIRNSIHFDPSEL